MCKRTIRFLNVRFSIVSFFFKFFLRIFRSNRSRCFCTNLHFTDLTFRGRRSSKIIITCWNTRRRSTLPAEFLLIICLSFLKISIIIIPRNFIALRSLCVFFVFLKSEITIWRFRRIPFIRRMCKRTIRFLNVRFSIVSFFFKFFLRIQKIFIIISIFPFLRHNILLSDIEYGIILKRDT